MYSNLGVVMTYFYKNVIVAVILLYLKIVIKKIFGGEV